MISNEIFIVIFWLLGSVPIVCFLWYPFFLRIFSFFKKPVLPPETGEPLPCIALIICAYNEEKIIRSKIENSLFLNYPKEKLRIVIHTDGSTDGTDRVCEEYANKGIIHIKHPKNRGKTLALNEAMESTDAPILVFSDANSIYQKDALMRLARWMSLKNIGCVCGRLKYLKTTGKRAEKGETGYWQWDTQIKKWEGENGYLVGANGAIFALRRSLAIVLPGNQSNDMILPIIARLKGYKAIFDPEAIAQEETTESLIQEYRRKIRIIARGLNGFFFALKYAWFTRNEKTASPGSKLFLFYQLLCKKLLRYLSFPSIALMMILGLFLPNGTAHSIALFMWLVFSAMTFLSLISPYMNRRIRKRLDFSYALAMAAAGIAGFLVFITGKTQSQWKSQR